ncbi:hypothetical protein [Streptomyces sp.]|uniref:hypothetical protein n=1 Tax=Streptomyces sp. TaxID=1931 RepID=UPI002F3F39D9
MAAGPRDTPHGRDTGADSGVSHESHPARELPVAPEPPLPFEPLEALGSRRPRASLDAPDDRDLLDPPYLLGPLDAGEEPAEHLPPMENGQSFRALRPQRRLRVWQLAPITALAVGGSLMFAFPLAFESGEAGPVVAMLGLLLFCCAAGWALTAARRIGHTWPGLPPRGSGARADWRFVAAYTATIALLAVLAVWRVARLR